VPLSNIWHRSSPVLRRVFEQLIELWGVESGSARLKLKKNTREELPRTFHCGPRPSGKTGMRQPRIADDGKADLIFAARQRVTGSPAAAIRSLFCTRYMDYPTQARQAILTRYYENHTYHNVFSLLNVVTH